MDFSGNQPRSFLNKLDNPSYRVLVVDDNPTDLHVVMNGLSESFTISFASSAQEALCLVTQHPQPDLILLDIVMPEMDGYQICQRLKAEESTAGIPVIFLSSRDSAHDKTKGFKAGGVDYVTKPMQLEELEARIHTHIRLKEQSQYLETMAFFDPLTRVANRRKYNEVLQREWARCIRYHQQISMILIDIDKFKEYNDSYGHSEGDNCLITVCRLLEGVSNRPADIFARIGGEEFVLLLPDCNAAGAVQKAEEMLKIIRDAKIQHEFSPNHSHLTISLGIATVFPSQSHSALSLFQAADDAMFSAKRDGRDRYCIAELDSIPSVAGEQARQHH